MARAFIPGAFNEVQITAPVAFTPGLWNRVVIPYGGTVSSSRSVVFEGLRQTSRSTLSYLEGLFKLPVAGAVRYETAGSMSAGATAVMEAVETFVVDVMAGIESTEIVTVEASSRLETLVQVPQATSIPVEFLNTVTKDVFNAQEGLNQFTVASDSAYETVSEVGYARTMYDEVLLERIRTFTTPNEAFGYVSSGQSVRLESEGFTAVVVEFPVEFEVLRALTVVQAIEQEWRRRVTLKGPLRTEAVDTKLSTTAVDTWLRTEPEHE